MVKARGPIRVAGVGAQVPGGAGREAASERLFAGPPAFDVLPELRWEPAVYAHELPPEAPPVVLGAILGEIDLDWQQMKLPPLSVSRMHQMEKAALAAMAEALEDAGIEARRFDGERVRVWVAATTLGVDPSIDHGRRIRRHELAEPVAEALDEVIHDRGRSEEIREYVDQLFNLIAPPVEPDSMMTSASILAGRVCNLFDFRGAHLAVDCSASSSMAAVEAAIEDLEAGACDVAVVCAISPLLTASSMLVYAHRGLLSDDPPRPFDPDGSGTMLGEGAIAVVLDRGAGAPVERARGWIEAIGSATLRAGAGDPLSDAVVRAAAQCTERLGASAPDVAFVASRALGAAVVDRAEADALDRLYAGPHGAIPRLTAAPVLGHLQSASGMLALFHGLAALERGRLDGPEGTLVRQGGDAELELAADARAAVSDAGLSPVVFHAIVAGPGAHAPRARIAGGATRLPELAITGMGAVVPGAEDVEQFWENIIGRVDSIGDLPASRWDVDRFIGASEELGAVLQTRLAAPVTLPRFDPVRFRIPPRSLPDLDPAVLLCLASAEQALGRLDPEPGWSPDRVAVVSGQLPLRANEAQLETRMLFAGHLGLVRTAMMEAGVPQQSVRDVVRVAQARFDATHSALSSDAMSTRTGLECAAHIARVWGFTGPMASVDAACASSLAAIAHGARRLVEGDVDAVVAAGVAYNLLPEYYVALSILGALSPRGAPPFDLGADGFVPGEGAGVVVLERLPDALRRGAKIHAVLRGIGVSSDGAGLSIFAPNTEGEQRAIRRALDAAGLAPREIDLLEAHGTGTKLGDQTELHSYAAVYKERDPSAPLTVGTVKSQIGHLSSAAGMVGLIKSVFAVREAVLPPSLGERLGLDLESVAIRLSGEAREWVVRAGGRRRAGVSAFGLGGINYHLVVEQPPSLEAAVVAPAPQALAPSSSLRADRFAVELVPRSLPARPPRAPLSGKVIWIVPDHGDAWRGVARVFEERGARCTLDPSPTDAPADGIVDLSTFGPLAEDRVAAPLRDGTAAVSRAIDRVRACYDHFAAAPPGRCFYVAVTGLGGALGLSGTGDGDPAGAALLGLAKGIKQELPATSSRGVDFDPHEIPEVVGEIVARELEDGNDQLEVAWAGRRLVPRLARLPHGAEPATRPVRDGHVVLMSGGGRGVVFECGVALARLGARVVVFGRTPLPSPEAEFLDLDDVAFTAWGREHLRRLREASPERTPRSLADELGLLRAQRELHANLRRAEEDALALEYRRCDVSDPDQVQRLVDDVRRAYGRVDGVAHGAMVEWSADLPNKRPERIAATMAVKVGGLSNLLAATAEDALEVFLCFGSGAGRFGNRGQSDYCAANAAMAAELASARRRDMRGTHFVTVDWTAWGGVGRAVSDPDLAEAVKATGVSAVSIEEGIYWFVREWTAGRVGEVVVFEERMLHDWPFLGERGNGEGERALEHDDLGRPFVAGGWPLVDRVLDREPGRVSVERRLDADRDALLAQHRLHDVPILPATFGCELLAEAAALCVPDMEVDAAYDVRIDAPAKLFRGRPLVVRARGKVIDHNAELPLVEAETRSRLMLRGRELSERIHHGGRFRLRPRGTGPREALFIEELEGTARARSFFHMARDPVTLGPIYSRGEWIQIRDRTVVGSIRAPRQRDITDRTAWPLFQVDPMMMDTAFQIAANWDGFGSGWVSIPYGMESLRMGRRRSRSEGARVRATVTRVEDPDVYYDIDVASEDGDMLMEIRGLHLRRIAAVDAA